MPDNPYAAILGEPEEEAADNPYAALLRPPEPRPDQYAALLSSTPPVRPDEPDTGFMGGLLGRLPDPVRERAELYGKSFLEGFPAGLSLAGSALKFLSGAGATERIRERAAERGVGLIEPLAPIMDPIQEAATTVGTEMQRMAAPAIEAAEEERAEFREEHPGMLGSAELVASYIPELVAKGATGLAGAALTLGRGGLAAGAAGIERALARRAAGRAATTSERTAGVVTDIEPVGPAAREALRAPESFTPRAVREIASESADDVVTGLKRMDPDVSPDAARAARELKQSMDTSMGGEQAVDLAEVATGQVRAAVRAAKHRLQDSQDFSKTLTAAEARAFNKRFPDREVQQDMVALLENTGNPFRGVDDTIEAVRSRLAKSGKLDKAEEAVRAWREEAAEMLDTFNAVRVEELGQAELRGVENYIHRALVRSNDARFAHLGKRLPEVSPVERERSFETLFEAVTEGGMVPKYETFGEAVENTRVVYEKALAAKRLLSDLSETNARFGGDLIARGAEEATRIGRKAGLKEPYQPFTSQALGSMIPGEGKLFIHPEAYKILRPVVEGADEPNYWDKAASLLKNFHFMGSFFHAGALTESNILAQGPIRGLRRAAEGGFGLPMLSRGAAKAGLGKPAPSRTVEGLFVRGEAQRAERMLETGRPWKRVESPEVEAIVPGEGALYMDELIADQFNTIQRLGTPETSADLLKTLGGAEAAASGVTLGRPIADTMLPLYEQIVEGTARSLRKKGVPGQAAARIVDGWQAVKRELDFGLWEHLHNNSKQASFHFLLDRVQSVRRGDKTAGPIMHITGLTKKRLAKMTDNEIRETVAKYVNDEFGGQNWARHTGKAMEWLSDPTTQNWLRRFFISPDWNISSTRATFAPVMGLVNKNPVQTYLGFRHWANRFFLQFAYANAINKALSGHYMWENERGKGRGPEALAPGAAYIDTGKPGASRYIRILKQEEDAFRLIPYAGAAISKLTGGPQKEDDFVSALSSKMWPELQTAMEAASRKPWEPGGEAGLFEVLGSMVGATQPFAVRSIEAAFGAEGETGTPAAIMFPTSGGYRNPRGFNVRKDLDESFEAGDMQAVSAIQEALIENGVPASEALHAVDLARKRYEKRLLERR